MERDAVVRQMAAGGGAGAISRTLTAPMERVKVILQVQSVSHIPIEKQYKGIFDCLVRIPREQGFLALWRGNGINVVRMIPNSAIKFTTFDYYKKLAFPNGEKSYEGAEKYVRKMVCGGLSGVSTIIPVYPMDLARTRLCADSTGRYRGVFHLFRTTLEREGITGIYKGLGVSLCGIIPYLAISLSTYDTLKDLTKDDPFWQHPLGKVLLGSCAAIVSQSIAYPLDTVRRHMQVSGGLGNSVYSGTLDCIHKVYERYGMRGFYRGLVANAARAAPQTGIEFACFDVIAGMLSEFSNNKKKHKASKTYDKESMPEKLEEDFDDTVESVEKVLVRRLSAALPDEEREKINNIFATLANQSGVDRNLISRKELKAALQNSGFEEYEIDGVLPVAEDVEYIDFYQFRELCQDKHIFSLLEQQYDEM